MPLPDSQTLYIGLRFRFPIRKQQLREGEAPDEPTPAGFSGRISQQSYYVAYQLATEIFELTQTFPKHETYSLTDQIRRSSRGVCTNIAEGYRKRRYPKHFTSKITDADGEASETTVWLDFARDCGYIPHDTYQSLTKRYEEVGRMLGSMADRPERFLPKSVPS